MADDALKQFAEDFKLYVFQKRRSGSKDLDQHRGYVLETASDYYDQVRDILQPPQYKSFFAWAAATQIFFLDLTEVKAQARRFIKLHSQGGEKPRTYPARAFREYIASFACYCQFSPGFSRPENGEDANPYYSMYLLAVNIQANIHEQVLPYLNLSPRDSITEFHRQLRSRGIPNEKILEIHQKIGDSRAQARFVQNGG